MIGQTIKDFRLVQELGRGGMGEVWLAEQQIIKTKVAIKILGSELAADQQQVRRFFNEAIAVGQIKHAGIAKIFDVGFTDAGRAFLIMELLEGDTLSARMATTPPALPAALEIARQIASVVAATHNAGVIHRDLKPDNVFLVPDAELATGERVKILDFGIAKLGSARTSLTNAQGAASMGTPGYMAPEQWTDASGVDGKADVYALGCIMFELVCGRRPFAITTIAEAYRKHVHEQPPTVRSVVSDAPQIVDELIGRMLSKRPGERPTMVAVHAVLSRIAGAVGDTSLRLSTFVTAAPQTTLGGAAIAVATSKRRRTGLIAGAALAAVVTAGTATMVMRGDDVDDDIVAAPAPPPAPKLREPKLGLDAIHQLANPTSSAVSNLHSDQLWASAYDDLADACKQPGAPSRWCIAADVAIGERALDRHDNATAVAAFKRAGEGDPTWALPFIALAGALSHDHDLKGALAAASTAQRLEPSSWLPIAAGARAYSAEHHGDDAIMEYRRAVALAPSNAVLLAEVALVYHAAGMDTEADKYAERALAIDHDMVSIHLMRAERALEAQDAKTALVEAEACLSVSPKNASAHIARGDALALTHDKPAAMAEYKKAIALAGDRASSAADARLAAIVAAVAKDSLPAPRNVTAQDRSRPISPSEGMRTRPGCTAADPLCDATR
jgi:tRNA A-37 threonylcarbamoyl transferase component Bud32/tetratricopeptide (TPR) repeat protein